MQKILQAHDDDGWLAATVDLFAGSDAGSHRAAAMYSLTKPPNSMASTRGALLPTFPARTADHPARQITKLPWHWQPAELSGTAV